MYREDPVNGIRRSWRRWSGLVAMLLIAAPVIARETIVLQKSGTDPQARGEDATLNQMSPNSNNVGNTLTVSGKAGANENAILEFDLSRTEPIPFLIFGRRVPQPGIREWLQQPGLLLEATPRVLLPVRLP
jgi:hypothetical protein